MSLFGELTNAYNRVDAVIAPWFNKILSDLGDDAPPANLLSDYPLVSSPTGFVLLIAFYFLVLAIFYPLVKFVTNPKGEKQKSGDLFNLFVQFHNVFLAGVSLWMGVMMIYYWFTLKYPIWGVAFDAVRDKDIAFVMYIFYISKYYEFFDTFIMLLKGNLSQVSFLHVYHHASTCFIFWWVSNKAPGGDAYFCITLNCWVHVVMYSYYFLTTVFTDKDTRARYLWWGQYLTQFQMSQFFANLIHAFWCLFYSPYSRFAVLLQAFDMAVLLALFLDFYIRKYYGDKSKKQRDGKTLAEKKME